MQEKIGRLEQDLASANRELDRMRARPAPAIERENYVIGEMDIVNRQVESDYVWFLLFVERDSCAVCCFD